MSDKVTITLDPVKADTFAHVGHDRAYTRHVGYEDAQEHVKAAIRAALDAPSPEQPDFAQIREEVGYVEAYTALDHEGDQLEALCAYRDALEQQLLATTPPDGGLEERFTVAEIRKRLKAEADKRLKFATESTPRAAELWREYATVIENAAFSAFETETLGAATEQSSLPESDDGEVQITLDPECIEGENVSEFYPQAHAAAMGALNAMLTPGTRDHRDADIIASCAVSEALKALVAASTQPDQSPETDPSPSQGEGGGQ